MMRGSVGDVVTQYHTLGVPLYLESRAVLTNVDIAYEQYGRAPAPGNTILACHALSDDAHIAGMHQGDKHPRWWDDVIGSGKALDTDRYCIIATNVIGGCKGSTDPALKNSATGAEYGTDFSVITIRDMTAAHYRFLTECSIHDLYEVVGGSMGGMQALQWSVDHPGFARRIVAIATSGSSTPMHIAFGAEERTRPIMTKSAWNNGRYAQDARPDYGLALARMIAHITYLSDQSMHKKFGRRLQKKIGYGYGFETGFSVESYLKHQGSAFVQRFDPNTYLYITKAIDYYDLTKNGSLAAGLEHTTAKFLILFISTDWLYPPYLSEEIVMSLNSCKKDVQYTKVMSEFGHDGFLLGDEQMDYLIGRFLTPLTVEDVMIQHPPTICDCATIRATAGGADHLRGQYHLPVLHADGTLCSIVTSWDIARAVADETHTFEDIMTRNAVCTAHQTIRRVMQHAGWICTTSRHCRWCLWERLLGMLTSEQLSNVTERTP